MKESEKMIKVNIKTEETVVYNQDVEMTQEQFDTLNNVSFGDCCCNQDGYSDLESIIDRADVFDNTGEFRNIEVEIIKPDDTES